MRPQLGRKTSQGVFLTENSSGSNTRLCDLKLTGSNRGRIDLEKQEALERIETIQFRRLKKRGRKRGGGGRGKEKGSKH